MPANAASQIVLGFDDALTIESAGGKFHRLAQLARRYRVPPAVCLSSAAFRLALSEQPHVAAQLTETIDRLYQSQGYQLDRHAARLADALDQIEVPADIAATLRRRLQDCLGAGELFPLVVRSSAVTEDQAGQTQAGIYSSFLGLADWPAVLRAIAKCWASYYSYRALAHRILLNNFDPGPQMAVIVQRMIEGEWSGVAFSRSPVPVPRAASPDEPWGYVELTSGTGERVVGGTHPVWGSFFRFEGDRPIAVSDGDVLPEAATAASAAACEVARRLDRELGRPIDLEWTWTPRAGLWVLQARAAQSAQTAVVEASAPTFQVHDLYTMHTDPGLDLRDCRAIYRHWSKKRGPQRRRAAAAGIALGGVAALEANLAGALASEPDDCPALNRVGVPWLILDASEHLRQLTLPRRELKQRIVELLESTAQDPWERRVFLLREYVEGSASLLSTARQDGHVLVEFAPRPLPELTRGFTQPWHLAISPRNELTGLDSAPRPPEAAPYVEQLQSQVAHLADFTRAEDRLHRYVCLEWVLERGRLVLIDASYPHVASDTLSVSDHRCLSPGVAQGRVLRVEADDWLADLSSSAAISLATISPEVYRNTRIDRLLSAVRDGDGHRTIVVAHRPIAALAVLIGQVAGFVFEDGPLLCHLGILLREQGTPAVFSRQAYVHLRDGQYVMLDNGELTAGG